MKWLPKYLNGYVLTPIQWAFVQYTISILSIIIFIHNRDNMFANITPIAIGFAVAIPLIWAIVMSFSRFIGNKKDMLIEKKIAKMENAEYDTVNAELATKYWYGYAIIGIAGALICSAIGLYAADVIAGKGIIVGDEELVMTATIIAIVLEFIADIKVFNKLGDVAYFIAKESDAIDAFLTPADATADEKETVDTTKLSDEQKRDLALMLLGLKK